MTDKITGTVDRTIRADTLRIHPRAQRELSQGKVKKLSESFDIDAIGSLHGVEYTIDGERAVWIVDGQHRLAALLKVGFGEWPVHVLVHTDVTDDARAADLFLKLNDRLNVHPYDKYVNELTAQKAETLDIDEIIGEHGFKAARGKADGNIAAVVTLKKVYGMTPKDPGAALDNALGTIVKAWGHSADASEGKIIEGIGLVYSVYNGEIDKAAFANKLSKFPGGASGVLGAAKGLKQYRNATLGRCVAETVLESYNHGRRNKLDPV